MFFWHIRHVFRSSQDGTFWKLIRNGYIHVYQKNLAEEVTTWECKLRIRDQIEARVKLDRSKWSKWSYTPPHTHKHTHTHTHKHTHTHTPIQTKTEVVNVKAGIKRRAQTSLDTAQQIIRGDFRSCFCESATDEQHKKKYLPAASL